MYIVRVQYTCMCFITLHVRVCNVLHVLYIHFYMYVFVLTHVHVQTCFVYELTISTCTCVLHSSGEEERELVVSLEQSIGHIGKCLGRDIQRSGIANTPSHSYFACL